MTDAIGRPDLRLQQRSMWLAYPMNLVGPAGQLLGSIDWPDAAAAARSGARPKPGALPMDLRGQRFSIEQTTLPQGWNSGLRLQLLRHGETTVLASLDVLVDKPRHPRLLRLTVPVQGELRSLPGVMRMDYAITLADGRRGRVQEPGWLTLRRTLDVRLPHGDDALRAFLGAAVLIASTSHAGTRW